MESQELGVEHLGGPFFPDDGLDPAGKVDSFLSEGVLIGGLSGQELEKENAEAVDVGFEGDFAGLEDLRGTVSGDPVGRRGGAEERIEAEVGDAGVVVGAEQDVG